jgi:hypothetical protein
MTTTDPTVIQLPMGLAAHIYTRDQLAAQTQAAPPPPDNQTPADRRATAAARSRARAPQDAQ